MATAPLSALSSTSAASGKTSITGQNYQSFLQLLSTQLKNQNPLSPLETKDFTNQLVQFSQVEQLLNLSSAMKEVKQQSVDNNLLASAQLINRTVGVSSNHLSLGASGAAFSLSLDQPAVSSSIQILDSTGTVVRQLSMPNDIGPHLLTWDGKSEAGQQLAPGNYTIKASAVTTAGKTIELTPTVSALIGSVSRAADGSVLLSTNVGDIPLTKVMSLLSNS
jgi:flagellar basal-body rod modification protein FlgD